MIIIISIYVTSIVSFNNSSYVSHQSHITTLIRSKQRHYHLTFCINFLIERTGAYKVLWLWLSSYHYLYHHHHLYHLNIIIIIILKNDVVYFLTCWWLCDFSFQCSRWLNYHRFTYDGIDRRDDHIWFDNGCETKINHIFKEDICLHKINIL